MSGRSHSPGGISAEEWQLLSFFAREPRSDPGAPWIYNENLYLAERGETTLRFAIQPANRCVRIVLSIRGEPVFEFETATVQDVAYRSEVGVETIEVEVDAKQSLSLRVEPSILIRQTVHEA